VWLAAPSGFASDGEEAKELQPELVFSFPNLEGDSISLSDERFRGKVVLIDIMGTWCGPCRRQAPRLQAFYDEYREQGFEVLGIAFERSSNRDPMATLQKYADDFGLEYEIVLGGGMGEVKRKFPTLSHVVGLFPTTIFIDRDGRVEGIEIGYEPWMDKDLEWNIQYLLKTPAKNKESKPAD
jgi:thiol-disulfide isomerase/thioredoxin